MTIFIFVFGLAIGSFLDCLVYRLNKKKKIWKEFLTGRSYCSKCKHQLAWFENIPLFSFIFLRGKCRWCHSPIGWHYPLVELATGIITVLVVFQRWPDGLSCKELLGGVFYLLIAYALIAIFLSDLRYWTIPDQITYPALIISFIFIFLNKDYLNIFVGLVSAAFFIFLVLITKEKGMGWGDVKLAGLMGLFLGFPRLVVALYLAFLTGAVVGVILILLGKKKFKSEIPFGPFLVGAAFIALFWGERIWQFFL